MIAEVDISAAETIISEKSFHCTLTCACVCVRARALPHYTQELRPTIMTL